MNTQKFFFLTLFLGVSALCAYIFSPFFAVILLGIVAGIALEPLYTWLQKKLKLGPTSAAGTTLFIVLAILTLATSLVGTQLTQQAQSVYNEAIAGKGYGIDSVSEYINTLVQRFDSSLVIDIQKYLTPVVSFVAQNIGFLVSSTAAIIFKFFLWLVTTYFVLKDGRKIKALLTRLSPLKDAHDNQLFMHIASASRSIVRGVFFVAIIQGVLVGTGLWLTGIENALFWGLIAAIAAPIPLLGTSIILIPSIVYLFVIGNSIAALILLVWGIVVVGLIDNVLTPYFYSKGTEIHPLILLFSILGGIALFGAIGFIVGPLVATITVTLITLYQEIVLEERVT